MHKFDSNNKRNPSSDPQTDSLIPHTPKPSIPSTSKKSNKIPNTDKDKCRYQEPNKLQSFIQIICSIILAACTVAIAIITGYYTHYAGEQVSQMTIATDAAKKSADVAEKTLITTQRPWLSVQMQIVSNFRISKVANQQDTITIRFIVKNVGNSPALGIDITPRICTLGPWQEVSSVERQICDLGSGPKVLKQPFLGYTLFPNDHFIQDISLGISPNDIEQFRTKITEFAKSINSPSPNTNYINLFLIGCVRYRFGFDGSLHKTGFIEEIGRLDPRHPDNTLAINITGPDIPSDMLVLKSFPLGAGNLAD